MKNMTKKKSSLGLILFVTFVTNVDFSFGIASLWPLIRHLGGTTASLSTASASFALSRLLSTPVLGYLCDHLRLRTLILTCLSLYLAGAGLFLTAESVESVYIARVFSGVAIAVLTPLTTHIAREFAEDAPGRVSAMGGYYLAQSVGHVLTPAVSAVLEMVDFDIAGINVRAHNAPGLISFVVTAMAIVAVAVSYVEPPNDADIRRTEKNGNNKSEKNGGNDAKNDKNDAPVKYKASLTTIFSTLFAWYAGVTIIGVMQVILVPYAESRFGWTRWESGILLSIQGLINAIIVYAIKRYAASDSRSMKLSTLTFISSTTSLVHLAFFLEFDSIIGPGIDKIRFVSSALSWCLAHGSLSVLLSSAYAGLITDRGSGKFMALLPLATSAARMTSPVIAAGFDSHNRSVFATVGFAIALLIVVGTAGGNMFAEKEDDDKKVKSE